MFFATGATTIGILMVALTFWQVFDDLFHPTAQGTLSEWIARLLWKCSKWNETLLSAAGPLTFIFVVFAWVFLAVVGFAFIYWPHLPHGFRFTGPPEHGLLAAAYFSTQALTTLSLADITPNTMLLRFTATFESMIGLGLVTASVSWMVLLYPALERMRTLARETMLLSDVSECKGGLRIEDYSEHILTQLIDQGSPNQSGPDLFSDPLLLSRCAPPLFAGERPSNVDPVLR